MAATLGQRLEVATCIACGARSRPGECAGGCVDVALDLVEASAVDALAARARGLDERIAALEAVVRLTASGGEAAPASLSSRAHEALTIEVPEPGPEPAIIAAWGCPDCGRIDAPQPCLDVCIRRPVPVTDASDYHRLAAVVADREQRERQLARVGRMLAHTKPRAGHEASHHVGLQSAARAALAAGGE